MGSGDQKAIGRRGGLLRRLRGREDAFALALLVQLAAFVIGPGAHLVSHRADHTHGPDGVSHTHELPVQPDGSPTPPARHDGHGAALHFGVALTSVPVFFWAFGIALALACVLWQPVERASTRGLFDVAHPRGPPLV